MQVARKVGAADDLPEGVLFVDAPLPAGPRTRPAVIIALPFLALGLLIALLALNPLSEPRDNVSVALPKDRAAAANDKKKDTPPREVQPAALGQTPLPEDKVVTRAKDLETILKDPSLQDRREIKLSGLINLADIGAFGFAAGSTTGQPLTLTSSELGLATLEFDPDRRNSSAEVDASPTGLTITGGQIVFDNLKILVKANRNWPEAVAAIGIRGLAKVVFQRCQFEQDVVPFAPAFPGIASVRVDATSSDGVPRIELRDCCFSGKGLAHAGQVAVAVQGPTSIHAVNCGFGPHAAFFQLRNGCRVDTTTVSLEHCSGFVFDGPVFGFQPGTGATLQVKASLFSRYDDERAFAAGHPPDLIHQTDQTPIRYVGRQSRYHHLNALWENSSDKEIVNTLERFKAVLKERNSGSDDSDQELLLGQSDSPWNADKPLQLPAELAFQVKPEFEKFGLQSCYWGKVERPGAREPSLAGNEKLYDPDYKGSSRQIFNSFERALINLDKGDTLFIKPGKDGRPIELPPTVRNQVNATLKAWPKSAPVLKLAFANPSDLAFFRVQEGKLHFEGLHFLLEARPELAGPLSVLKVGDNVQATFDHCVFTLRASGSNPSSVVSLLDPKERMMPKSDTPAPGSRVEFRDSFIRGEGDLANLCSCRRLYIGLTNTLVAVAGSLVDLDIKSDDATPEQGPRVELKRSSVFSREPIFALSSSKAGKGLGQVHIDAGACLFAALAKRPLIYLKAPDVQSEAQLSKYLDWRGEQNTYARFDKVLEYERPDEMGTAMQLASVEWGKLFGESPIGRDEILLPPLGDVVLSQVRPNELRPRDVEAPAAGVSSLAELEPLLKALDTR
jgi:hypothetical protein